ncbi:MAG TPA: MFS transporter [Prolixibacteraceae bacterium]|nr:MFS transporter [Prolixibacteraceae bacterium]
MARFRLSLMMFLQYMMYAVWWVPLAAYLTNLEIGATQKALILSSMAIGCLLSPVIGMLADRLFAAQKVLAGLNLINAVMLFMAGTTNNPDLLFIFLIVAMLGYMPSWGLTSSIAMTHLPSEQFPKVRVFGSIGWVTSGIFSVFFIKVLGVDFDGTNLPFYCGAGVSLLATAANLMLPKTPPAASGQKFSMIDAFGLGTLQLMKDRNFAFFILFSFLSMIPFAMYYSYFSEFLLNMNTKYISVTMNWGVLAEMGFMLLIPIAIKRFGLRNVMILGLVAMIIRYLSLYAGGVINQNWMFYIGILIHGLIFGFFYVGGQIYIEKKSPAPLKSQAQGFIFLVTFGVGLLVGNLLCGELIQLYKNENGYNWDAIWGITTISSIVLLLLFVLFFKKEKEV